MDKLLTRLRIRTRLAVVIGLMLAGMLYFSINEVADKYATTRNLESIKALSTLAVKSSAVIHELQKERGLSAGFIGSKGARFKPELDTQRGDTDRRLGDYRSALAHIETARYGAEFAKTLDQAATRLTALAATRERVGSLGLAPAESFAYYTDVIAAQLQVISYLTRLSSDAEVGRSLTANLLFLDGKEQAGRERATVNGVFAANQAMDPAIFQRLAGIIAAQDAYFGLFRAMADSGSIAYFERKLNHPVSAEVENMRKVAVAKARDGDYGVDPAVWFKTITDKINLMKEVEDHLSSSLLDLVETLERSAQRALLLSVSLSVAGILIGILLGFAVARSIVHPIDEVLHAANRMAAGDLTVDVSSNNKDETGLMLAAIRNMITRLTHTIGEVRQASRQLLDSSAQVAATSQSLSQVSSEQAASVEQTSASVEQIAASVGQNNESAKLTGSVAAQAAREAVDGGRAVDETAAAMKQIASKIGIVDDIAYQTNLLALNAAIEAARAGEHGKGFAVVASEVRKLAERSQVAAREISELASGSVKLAAHAGELLNRIVPGIEKTSELVQGIAVASAEQSNGIAQINVAMTQISKPIQHMAAASEELAATAGEMSGYAEHLTDLMSFFKLPEGQVELFGAQPAS
ncbi:MAG: nitrate- and nitrite sensing domain-containing protein [Rhodocyclales bacterium]|nr:nitrate- and nitrite sensing domain-containing protein [Rhodocyclales bacterium]